jgi:hypothetical protein
MWEDIIMTCLKHFREVTEENHWKTAVRLTRSSSSSSSVALQSVKGPWAPHTGWYIILSRKSVGLLWTSDQPFAKASTYTGQHSIETKRQTSMPRAGFEPTITATKRPQTYALYSAVTGIGRVTGNPSEIGLKRPEHWTVFVNTTLKRG